MSCRCPRLVIVTLDEASPPDFAAIRSALVKDVPGASFDDHRTWVDRLVSMARSTVLIGMAVLGLVIAATVLTVIFATRGAMAGNEHIIEVLHFIGADQNFVARQFERHFFWTALKGAALRRRACHDHFPAVSPGGPRATWQRPRPIRRRRFSAIFPLDQAAIRAWSSSYWRSAS